MLRTSIQQRTLSFTSVDNYAVYEEGHLHIGRSIRRFLNENRITIVDFADMIGLTRGGANHILKHRFVSTDRLEVICRALDYNFFQLFAMEYDSTKTPERMVGEPEVVYPKQPPKRSKITLEIENGEVVGTTKQSPDDDTIKALLEAQKKQFDLLMAYLPDLARKMAEDPSLNPLNMSVPDFDGDAMDGEEDEEDEPA